jgi:hypothetical protein
MSEEIVKKLTGEIALTLGHIIDCGTEYVVYDGADYIGFNKNEYEVKRTEESN